MRNEEYHIQKNVVTWLKMKYPKALITISPSGNKLPLGVARRFKFMGYTAGTPDLMILEPRKGFNGMFVELKTPTGRLTKDQRVFLRELNDRNYHAVVAFGYDQAVALIENYMKSGRS